MASNSACSASSHAAGGCKRRLVGVQPDLDVDLGRVVALTQTEVRPRFGKRHHRDASRSRIDSAWAASPSASAMAIDVRRHPRQGRLVEGDHVDLLQEVVDPERAREAGRAVGGQHVARPGQVVADARRGAGPAEHGAGVADQRQQGSGIGGHQLEVLGGHHVGHLHGLLRAVDEHGVAAPARVASISARRGASAVNRADGRADAVGRLLRPGDQPGQAVGAVLGLHDHVDGGQLGRRGLVGDHDHLGRAGEGRRHADAALLATSRLAMDT